MIKLFRFIAFLEGSSYILLLFIAVPIKYFLYNDYYVKMLGMPHGILFVIYIILTFINKSVFKWNSKQFRITLLASIVPFGTFYVDRKYLI